ncbi:Ankyrin-repeat protein [Orpheovirus IHUMI-LCC2]|uniref:Ankyrin-repeat protein n=1 Tax=Orpheovirus IHUMI-LCC2 TaxID=2023057 RepID=A0A2I2L496_9VIRU|nr:Ankyrin-repeat protein [Orpheovirus IHUMI-LCC2]SNW62289.1 Ankyrin-repeat protein [Orpheovirus IHUMI-LCC2]
MIEYNIITKDVFHYMINTFLSIDERNILRLLNKKYRDKYKNNINLRTLVKNGNIGTLQYLYITNHNYYKCIRLAAKLEKWDIFSWISNLRHKDTYERVGGNSKFKMCYNFYSIDNKISIIKLLKDNLHLLSFINPNIDLNIIIENNIVTEEPYLLTWLTLLRYGIRCSNNDITSVEKLLYYITEHGSMEALKFIHNISKLILNVSTDKSNDIVRHAIEGRSLEKLRWLYENGYKLGYHILPHPYNTPEIIDWLIDNYLYENNQNKCEIYGGDLFVAIMHQNTYATKRLIDIGIKPDSSILGIISKHNDINLLDWALKYDININNDDVKYIYGNAMKHNNIKIINWLKDKGFYN